MSTNVIGRGIVAAILLYGAVVADVRAGSAGIWSNIEQPTYPRTALYHGEEGQMLVDFEVDERGHIANPTIVSAAPRKVFDEAVLDALKAFRVNVAEARHSNEPLPHRLGFIFQFYPCAVGGGPFYLDTIGSGNSVFATVFVCGASTSQAHPKENFVEAVIAEQKQSPSYAAALHDVETLESALTGERTETRPAGTDRGLKTAWLKPVVGPAFRQAGLGGGAVVKFSVTGAGRAKDIVAVETGSDPTLGAALTRAVSLWLFDPVVEGPVAVTRTGYVAALLVGYKNPRTGDCNEPKLSGPVDYEVHLCF